MTFPERSDFLNRMFTFFAELGEASNQGDVGEGQATRVVLERGQATRVMLEMGQATGVMLERGSNKGMLDRGKQPG